MENVKLNPNLKRKNPTIFDSIVNEVLLFRNYDSGII